MPIFRNAATARRYQICSCTKKEQRRNKQSGSHKSTGHGVVPKQTTPGKKYDAAAAEGAAKATATKSESSAPMGQIAK
jgi:hypothetical protein